MSIFSKLFKMFLAVVLMPVLPMILLLAYYQLHLKYNILETHANLAQMVSASINQHIEDLEWRLAFTQKVQDSLVKHKNPTALLEDALAVNPDFVMLAVLSAQGKEIYRAGDAQLLSQMPPLDLSQDPSLPQLARERRISVSRFVVVDGRPVTEFIYPMSNGDYLYGILSFFGFLARVQEQRIGRTGHVYIVGQGGEVYANDYLYKPDFDTHTLQKLFLGKSHLIKDLKAGGQTYVGAYAPTPILGAYVAVLQRKSEAYRNIYYTNVILALFLLTIATLSYFGALTFAEQLGEPIGALCFAAREISQGNLDEKVDPEIGWGEFKSLINSFNQMTADLKDYQVLQLAQQVSEMKEQVFRSVAHDLRAPLLGLQGYIYILQSGKVSKKEEKNYLEMMSQSARNLSALLEDVLDVSRVQAGISAPQKERVNVAELINRVIGTVAPTAQEKNLSLTSQVKPIFVSADPKLLQRVFTNLISNAIKFTEEGFIQITANQDEKCYRITVADSGIGMTEAERKGLFQKFHQVHADKPGYGLGLFISRQIVEAHGGTLEVCSTPGKGSAFTVCLPKEDK